MFKPKIVLLLTLAASALVASYLYSTINTSKLEPTESKPVTPIVTDKSSSKNSEKEKLIAKLKSIHSDAIITSSDDEIIKEFIVSLDAAAAMDIIDKAYSDGNESLAHNLEAKLYARCTGLQNISDLYEAIPNTASFIEEIKSYCASYTEVISGEEHNLRSTALTKEAQLENSQLKTKIKDLNLSDQASAIVNQIVNSKTRSSLGLTNALLYEFNQNTRPGISFTQLEYPYYPELGFDTHYAAIDLYGCIKFGGCESGQYFAQWRCINSGGQCRPGWSVYDYYGNNLSSNELENVILILQFLLDQ